MTSTFMTSVFIFIQYSWCN